MNNFIALSRVFIKNIINSAYKNNKLNIKTIAIVGLIILSFLPIVINLIRFLNYTYDVLVVIGQEGVLISLGIVITGLLVFFLGLFYIISTFYFSNDIETLLPLPLKPYEIISAKFLIVLLYEYITALVILVPSLGIYGINSGAGITYYILSIITLLLFPIVPLTLGSIIVMVVMRFSNVAKNKDLFKLVGGITALVIAFGVNILIQRFMNNVFADPEALQNLIIEGNNSLIQLYSSVFPGLKFLVEGLLNSSTYNGIFNFIIFIAITIVLYTIFLFIAEKIYFKGVAGISEVGSKKKELSKKQLEKGAVRSSVILSYTSKELRILFRTPIYFLNCILISFIFPFILLLPVLTQQDGLNSLLNLINERPQSYVVVLGFALAIVITSTNAITSTSISREGLNYYFSKYIPVKYEIQIVSKVMSGVIMGLIGTTMLCIIAVIVLNINIYLVLITLIISMLGTTFAAMIGILIDLYNPKLIWDSEQRAVKQNLNVLFHTLIGSIFAGVTFFFVFKSNLGLLVTITSLLFVYGILNFALYKILMTLGVKLYSKITV
ncbi:putative ABC transporter permease subunit [Serpentinicella alkaliphila]|uniref:ABC-2 type transport system permease protein n=1 Tax=Serpentinicella alkaliphila TaxID=1734049 RepID=A0A4V2T3M9_9FIRM|nr:hypothetical protein [Serpentinicella alkaliphila]QUH25929.1 hypothetical protein HZR23_09415 [Serpentinicella alkaliphila]TCQ02034.1 ABC-2 type transport system permease protein [Serpentinicella alkaliphila]